MSTDNTKYVFDTSKINSVANRVTTNDNLEDYHTLFSYDSLQNLICNNIHSISSTNAKMSCFHSSNYTNKLTKIDKNTEQQVSSSTKKKNKDSKKTEYKRNFFKNIDNQEIVDYDFDGNTILVIQNSLRLINFLSYFKRPCEPTIYMFIESNNGLNSDTSHNSDTSYNSIVGSVVFVASCASAYPIIFAKFPIIEPCVKAVYVDSCYYFPLRSVINFIQKTDRTHARYVLALKQNSKNITNKQSVILEFKSIISNSTSTCQNVIPVQKEVALQEVFFNKINTNALFAEDTNANLNYLNMINNMEVLMLINNSDDLSTFAKSVIENSNQKLIISKKTITLTQQNSVDCNEQVIAEKDKSLIWKLFTDDSENDSESYNDQEIGFSVKQSTDESDNIVVTNSTVKTLNMIKYASLFKNYEKIINNNDNVYYALCNWRKYEKCNSYMFVKIISSETLKSQVSSSLTNVSFGDLFSNIEIIFELYLCHEM